MIGSVISTPGTPEGASINGALFSSIEYGAWSEAILSTIPFETASKRAFAIEYGRNGGFTLANAPLSLSISEVKRK